MWRPRFLDPEVCTLSVTTHDQHDETIRFEIREPVASDGRDLAAMHCEAAHFYAALAPDSFQQLGQEQLEAFFTGLLQRDRPHDQLWLVGVRNETVVGNLLAHIRAPLPEAHMQMSRDLGEVVVIVDALEVAASQRRSGLGRDLMAHAESWGRERDATRVMLETYANSPISVPFYERGLGYARHSIIYAKGL